METGASQQTDLTASGTRPGGDHSATSLTDDPNDGSRHTLAGSYCPRCGAVVPFSVHECPNCGQHVEHAPSTVQRNGLLAGLGFIILGGIFIFCQPNPLGVIPSRFVQDVLEIGIVLSVSGAGISFFIAVADMVRRGGE